MIKKIIVSLGLLLSLVSNAQEGTSSPYSFYGIGDVKFKGTVENRSMGGLSIFPDSIHLNLQNPAQFASLKLTSFAIGGSQTNTKLKTDSGDGNSRRTTLDYLAVGIPAGKLGFGFGLIPYSSVGYKNQRLANENNPETRRYYGTGGINKVFAGLGYKLSKNINIGADFNYNFGTIETTGLRYISNVQFGTRERNHSDISGVNFNTGITYKAKLTKKIELFSSVTYSPEANLKLDNSRKIATVQFLPQGGERVIDEENIEVSDTELKLPSKLTFGLGLGEVKKWIVGAEVTQQNSSNLGNRFSDINNATFENSVRYSLGGYYIPDYKSFSGYFKKVVYRAGMRYENTGLVIENNSIKDFAANIGMGLPLSGTFSNINVGLELGKRGTKDNGLVEENYLNLSVGLSLNDRWFVKRKYD